MTQSSQPSVSEEAPEDNGSLWSLPALFLVGTLAIMLYSGDPDLTGDSSMYLLHARNLAFGIPFSETGYHYNPLHPQVGPLAYPPGYPILLAPLVWTFGLTDWFTFKVLNLTMLLLTLALFHRHLRAARHPGIAALVVTAIGVNPVVFRFTGHVLSDAPFLLWLTGALILADSRSSAKNDSLFLGTALGLYTAMAIATRIVGAILLPVLICGDLIRYRKVKASTILAVTIASISCAVQLSCTPSIVGYTAQIDARMVIGMQNLVWYSRDLLDLLIVEPAFQTAVLQIGAALLILLALVGLLLQVRHQAGPFEMFTLFYLGLILFWPTYQGLRLFLPLVPMVYYYFLRGFEIALPAPIRHQAVASCLVLLISVSLWSDLQLPKLRDVDRASAAQVFEAIKTIRQRTEPGSLIMGIKPRVVALYCGRPAMIYPATANASELQAQIEEFRVSYLLEYSEEPPYYHRAISGLRSKLTLIHSSPGHKLYRVRRAEVPPPEIPQAVRVMYQEHGLLDLHG